ncbi:MAG: diguanylate cyclase [Candidatus Electrothrix sp. AR3]|nr:diguanylate cyclase [Candidatus Electrothrix sp. AR3]
MSEVTPPKTGKPALSGKEFFFEKSKVNEDLTSYEKSSPLYSLLSGQKVGQIPIDEHKEIDQEELLGYRTIISALEWVLLLLVLLSTRLPGVTILQPTVFMSVTAVFALFISAAQFVWRSHYGKRWNLALNTWAMLIFITAAAWQTGGASSPLAPLYFIGLMLIGTILGSRIVALQTLFITICYIFLAADTPPSFAKMFSLDAGQAGSILLIHLVLLWMTACFTALVARENDRTKDKIRQLSRTDQLTGLWNMKMLLIFMQREYQRTLIGTGKFSILMIDADSLKAANDAYGHHAGTMLIVSISETMPLLCLFQLPQT